MAGPSTGHLLALVSAHVAAPHRYRRYFPQEWLDFVQDRHCKTRLELHSERGRSVAKLLREVELSSGYRHASLDVAAFMLEDSDGTASRIAKDFGLKVLTLSDASHSALDRSDVIVAGHRLHGERGSGEECVERCTLAGRVSLMEESRGYVDTGLHESEMGMCGGPVVLSSNETVCIGLLEGLVPRLARGEEAKHERHSQVAGHSVFISANELRLFLKDVETSVERKRLTQEENS